MAIYILGTGLSHNGSSVILKDGNVLFAIEKERLTGIKHDGGNDYATVDYCLKAAGITINELDLVVQCANFEKDEIGLTNYQGKRIFPADYKVPVISISHHLAHAYSTIGSSPFSEAHAFVLDGCGSPYHQCIDVASKENLAALEMFDNGYKMYCEKDSFYEYKNNKMQALIKDFSVLDLTRHNYHLRPSTTTHSIGGFYGAVSNYCFGGMDDAGKLMGLAPYGKANAIKLKPFILKNGRAFINENVLREFTNPAKNFEQLKSNFSYYANIASWAQKQVEEAVLYTLYNRLKKQSVENLCYAGGVALNALTNARIKRELDVKNLYIEPASADNGLALGCAYYGWLEVLKKKKKMYPIHTFFGFHYPKKTIEDALTGHKPKIKFKEHLNITEITADLLNKNKIIAWFQNASEFGPRALGNRSILASPLNKGVKDFINKEIKKREDFRPFAPAILAEDISEYYKYNELSPYMLLVNTIKPAYKELLADVVHENKTSRVQTVAKEDLPLLHKLLSEFKKLSGHGILLNTSFNKRGTPIVETPSQAIAFFLESKLDYLIINNTIVERNGND